jgi:hypothetical protein
MTGLLLYLYLFIYLYIYLTPYLFNFIQSLSHGIDEIRIVTELANYLSDYICVFFCITYELDNNLTDKSQNQETLILGYVPHPSHAMAHFYINVRINTKYVVLLFRITSISI